MLTFRSFDLSPCFLIKFTVRQTQHAQLQYHYTILCKNWDYTKNTLLKKLCKHLAIDYKKTYTVQNPFSTSSHFSHANRLDSQPALHLLFQMPPDQPHLGDQHSTDRPTESLLTDWLIYEYFIEQLTLLVCQDMEIPFTLFLKKVLHRLT